MNILKGFLGTLFPDRCVDCKARGSLLCGTCLKKVAPASAPAQNFITSVFAYHDFRVKRLVWLLKYRNARHVAEICAPALAGALTEFLGEEHSFLGDRPILAVPIPLSKKRLRTRGYNQAELLAKEMIKLLPPGRAVLDTRLLQKIAETKPQADIKKRNIRLVNLGDCFKVFPDRRNAGELVVLIDDVTTTGATLTAARKALRAAGFAKVYALTVAH